MLDHNWGRVSSVQFPFMSTAVDVSRDPVSGKYVYSNLRNPDQSQVDPFASVWKMSLGLVYDF